MDLIEGLQTELVRCKELLKLYESIPTGHFGAAFLHSSIKRGETAIISGDIVEMTSAYAELKDCE